MGPTTSSGKGIDVTVGASEAVKVTIDVPRTALVEAFFAMIVRVACAAWLDGAVYKPF